ncbi:hypothetical protein ARMSODRAFT_937327 [Armillaria solidipes]|uniref:Prolyl 4-hydroxylase alpha subunit domain-containing protein n=1 Tax=Armillaria solidipes TaxID=1076256 RepID=A0A2H3BBK2_9AGAR|nr:hypothetical protein ARMSODRAFT_937327 [Armillaria solidipes]
MSAALQHPEVETIKKALTEAKFSYGLHEVPLDKLVLFYTNRHQDNHGASHFLNLASATEESLQDLCNASDPASFGLGNKDTFDESYRKAKKLDSAQFACTFDLQASGILDQVQVDLVEGCNESAKVLRAELYKLNAYAKGDFFKAHKDTPRSENMIGSLVIIFPTDHQGGSFILRQDGQEWTFGAEKMLADSTREAPVISHVAFYSDIEHEVLPVTSGVRVTLTYNLYLEDKPRSVAKTPSNPTTDVLKTALQNLLTNEAFLPQGGLLGFGLRHQYPFAISKYRGLMPKIDGNPNEDFKQYINDDEFVQQGRNRLSQLADSLKGNDANILRACRDLGLDANIRILYRPRGDGIIYMVDHVIPDKDEGMYESNDLEDILLKSSGTLVSATDEYVQDQYRWYKNVVQLPEIIWVTPITTFNRRDSSFIAYGNKACVGYLYGDVCLIVKVGRPGSRTEGQVQHSM